jgi:hypothetical protein
VVIPIKKEYKGMKIGVITVWLSFITSQNAWFCKGIMSCSSRLKLPGNVIGKLDFSIAMKNYHMIFIITRNSVW